MTTHAPLHDATTAAALEDGAATIPPSPASLKRITLDDARRLPPITLIGLVGPAGAGKDTVADHLQARYGFTRAAFADPLRAMVSTLAVHIPGAAAHISERSLKEAPMPVIGRSYRRLAQTLGTEWGRQLIDTEIWVRLAEHRLGLGAGQWPIGPRIVLTDVRFHNEAAWVRSRGGYIVRVVRDTQPVHLHESEAHLGHITSTARLFNDGTLAQLHERIDEVMAMLDIARSTDATSAHTHRPQDEADERLLDRLMSYADMTPAGLTD